MRPILILILSLLLFSSCKNERQKRLIIFNAGSLSLPFKKIAAAFERENQGIEVIMEASGSRVAARKISELKRRADIMASSDYTVINALLIPKHASFVIRLAGNEMVIATKKGSRQSSAISSNNWYKILSDPKVAYGRSDPNADPCGYRAVMVIKLAEQYYGVKGLSKALLAKDTKHIRPKETDLLALLEAGVIDYLFIYRSVAIQHRLPFITLPDKINLGSSALAKHYRSVAVKISGKKPGTFLVKKGAPMVYGVTIPTNAPHRDLALKFMVFLLSPDKGLAIMKAMGQKPLVPAPSKSFNAIPEPLQRFARSTQ